MLDFIIYLILERYYDIVFGYDVAAVVAISVAAAFDP